MRSHFLALAVFTAIGLVGCRREQPTAPPPSDIHVPPPTGETKSAAIKPFLVKTNAGIAHEFYRDIRLEELLKTLPQGSIDSIDLVLDKGPQLFALVHVPDQPGKDLTKHRFETTFRTKDGEVIDKRWTAAEGRKSGHAKALFCVPLSVVDAETKVVLISD